MKKKLLFAVALVVMLGVCLFAAVGCESEPAVKTYTVTFDANGGTMKEATITVAEGDVVDLTKYVPQKDNWQFVGWASEGETVTKITVNANITLVAAWKENLVVSCNIETAEIVNDVIAFEVAATSTADAVTVTYNGNVLPVGKEGLYVATLEKGNNTFVVKATRGDDVLEKTYEIDYKGFTVVTDLYDVTTGDSAYAFNAVVRYGEDQCEAKVAIGETSVDGTNDKYTLAFAADGTYNVTVGGAVGRMHYTENFTVVYDSSLPKFAKMTLAANKQYRGNVVAFTLTAKDAEGNKLADSNVAFYADFDVSDDNDEFTQLTSKEISTVWSDGNATSYKLFVTEGGFANGLDKTALIKVVLTSGDKTVERLYRVCYVGPDADGCIGEVVVSIDGFTVGVGYILEPTIVKVYQNGKFPQYLKTLIEEKGWTMDFTGSLDSGFYLSSLNGLDIPDNVVNERLAEVLAANNMTVDETSISPGNDGTYSLGEFCYNSYSGWMYSINGMFANYGMADYDPVDGDVVQIRFTLAYGADIGGAAAMGGFMPTISQNDANYGEFNTAMAKIAAANFGGKGRAKLDEVLAVVTDWDVEQSVVDNATKTLREYYAL